ncbi:hypothetical protein F5Y03DRAFT_4820 [Xylaria venustula]|nr:hypothetical protein F5Y03DRAFT_4820 [Xylaria venustula]
MIRQPLHSAVGRTRSDLSRVTDGIAASLRAFSTVQQLAVDNDRSSNGGSSPRPTGRQRAAAAFSDLVEMNNSNTSQPPRENTVFKKLDFRSDASSISIPRAASPRGPNIIRGGFRGRGGFGGRGGAGGLRGGRGRPRGSRREGDGDGDGEGRGRRRRDNKERYEKEGPEEDEESPAVLAMREAKELGSVQEFDPSISLADLVGWGPAVATAGSRMAKDDTVMRQARILGGGQPFHPLNFTGSDEMWKQYKDGSGVFFPTEEMKKRAADTMGLEAFPPVPKETKDAVLQSALLGTYQGPQYTDAKDTLGSVRNYVKRDASWNADAERRIEEKIRSLLPGGRTGPVTAAGEAKKGA